MRVRVRVKGCMLCDVKPLGIRVSVRVGVRVIRNVGLGSRVEFGLLKSK